MQGANAGGSMERGPAQIDVEALGAHLSVLAYASRLRLLMELRTPKTIEELRLPPGPSRAGERPERPISRQAMLHHLNQLEQIGLVKSRAAQRGTRRNQLEYIADLSRFYAILEEFRQVGQIAPMDPAAVGETIAARGVATTRLDPGPKVIVVRGTYEGRAYPLRADTLRGSRGWVIGRRAGTQVRLDYDPFVSGENAEILPDKGGFKLLDLRSSRNGTFHNWNQLPTGGEAPLRPGDVIGVGRSLLVFRQD